MTVHKRWGNERSRDRFFPHYLEYEDCKWGELEGILDFVNTKGVVKSEP